MEKTGILLWEPDSTQLCQYLYMNEQNGSFAQNVWIADSKEFALSFEKNEVLQECNRTLAISDQGFGVLLKDLEKARIQNSTRFRRETGIVLSEQLAAQFTAFASNIKDLTVGIFKATLEYVCSGLDAVAQATLALAAAQPTLLSRKILNTSNIEARLVGADLLEIRPCEILNLTEIDFYHV
uniref:Uncharacterized protein n=1 Tax=Panagrolaimus superbus TaxID=310955 RepID=A0A914YN65_9BILA